MSSNRIIVIGYGVCGRAMTAQLLGHGAEVVVTDDRPDEALRSEVLAVGAAFEAAPDAARLAELLAEASAVCPSPGVPDHHPVFAAAAAAGVPVVSEFDLARVWDRRPVVAITGTNGKTTVTMMVAAMLEESGVSAVTAGNTEVPLVSAIADPDAEVFVVEASSFRLGHTHTFRPRVATWLNFAPDHLDVHRDLAAYELSKARIWASLGTDDLAVANAEDPVVMAHVPRGARVVTFGRHEGDYRVSDGALVGPEGPLVGIGELWRDLPHDVTNGLAAAATALGAGAGLDAVRAVLRTYRGLPHRVQLIGEHDGVRWYDDSKATAPHATVSAVMAFASVVLVAGGLNKGLDLSALAEAEPRLRAVVGIGDAGPEVVDVFSGRLPTAVVTSMAEAVDTAAAFCEAGDTVLLSPGCASFDWYRSYGERGEDFTRLVHERIFGGERVDD